MCNKPTRMEAYDNASLRILNAKCATQLLLDSQPSDHVEQHGHDQRDFLLASILEGLASANASLGLLSPYKAQE